MKMKLWTVCMMTVLFASSWPSTAAVADGDDDVPETLTPGVLTVDAATGRVQYDDQDGLLVDVRVVGVASSSSGFDLLDPFGRVVFGNQSSTFAGVVEFWYQVLLPGTYTVTGPDGTVLVTFDASPYSEPGVAGPSYKAPPAACRLNLAEVRGIDFAAAQTCDDDGGGTIEPCNDCIDTDPCPEDGYNCLINDPCEGGCTEIRECRGSDVGVELNEDKHYCYNTNLCPTGIYNCVPLPCQGTNEQSCADYLCNGICDADVNYCDVGTGVEPACLTPCPSGSMGYQVGAVKVLCLDPEHCEAGTGVPPACLTPCPSGSTGYMVGGIKQTCVGPYQITGCGAGYTGYTVNGQRYCIENAEPCNQEDDQWGVEGNCHKVTWCGDAGYAVDGRPLVCIEKCDSGSGVEPVCQDTKPCTGQNYQWGLGDCHTVTWCGDAGYSVDGKPVLCVQKCDGGSGVEPVCQDEEPCTGQNYQWGLGDCYSITWCGDSDSVGYSIDGNAPVCLSKKVCTGQNYQWGISDCHTVTWCGDSNKVIGYTIDGTTPFCVNKDPCETAPNDCDVSLICVEAPSPADCATDYACSTGTTPCEQADYCGGHPESCAPAGAPNPDSPPSPNPNQCSDSDTTMVQQTYKLSERTVWTPTLIIHAPAYGTAEVTGSWSETNGVFVGGHGATSTIEAGQRFGTDDGMTRGSFRVAAWGYYEVVTRNHCGENVGSYRYAKIFDDEPNGFFEFRTFYLYGPSVKTDRDDAETVSGCSQQSGKCYDGMRFANRYLRREVGWDTRGGYTDPFVSSRTFQAGGGSLSFSVGGKSVSASLEVSYVADKTSDIYYQYHLPADGLYSGDYLGKKAGSALAFCDDISNGNC